MRFRLIFVTVLLFGICSQAQTTPLSRFLERSIATNPQLKNSKSLEKIGEIQNKVIRAQQQAFNVNATSEVLFAPYFNNNGKAIDVTTNPSQDAYGYDAGITNGGLYAAQLNVTKNLFNQAATDNLLFQNKLKGKSYALKRQVIERTIKRNITRTYIVTYQYQLKEELIQKLIADLEKRLKVVGILVKHGILMQTDYALVKLNLKKEKINLKQAQNNFASSYAQLSNLSGMHYKAPTKIDAPTLNLSPKKNTFLYQKQYKNDSLKVKAANAVFDNKYKPHVSAYANAGLNALDLQRVQHSLGFSVGLRLTIPIYDGHQKKYNQQKNKFRFDTLSVVRDNTALTLKNTLKSLEEQISTIQQSLQLIEDQIEIQKDVLEIYKEKFSKGEVSVVGYLNVLRDYENNRFAKLQMLTNLSLLKNQYNYTNQ